MPSPNHRQRIQDSIQRPSQYGLRQRSGWILGPLFLLLTLVIPPPESLSVEGWRTAGVALLMATWWISESIPIPITALVPMAAFPLIGLSSIREAASPYANPLVYLFLGGFMIALAMQRWNLHKRLALSLIDVLGLKPHRIIAGFLLAGATVSMWVSNTATTLMMLPIASSVLALLPSDSERSRSFGTALMLAVAYGCTTGGMATLIGTPPNALLAGYLNRVYGYEIGFAQWMTLGLPVTLVTLPIVYLVLTKIAFKLPSGNLPGMADLMAQEKAKLSRLSKQEIAVAIVFACTATAWITRPFLQELIPLLSDTTVAILGAIALFMIPIDAKRGEFLMRWEDAKALPWDVLLLFGGGLSLASAIQEHGLSQYLGELSGGLQGLPIILIVAILCFGILLLTELTSNTATAATFLPIVAAIAVSMGQHPLLLLAPAALAANCSYMMPVGTPPNAIVFGSGAITLPQMARTGLLLNILLVPIIVAILWILGPIVFDIQFNTLPPWAQPQ